MTKAPRPPLRTVDALGRATCEVALADGHRLATRAAAAFLALMEAGLTRNWYLNGNALTRYVRAAVNARGNGVGVARLIMRAGPGQIVKYRDGNVTNLCRENLWVTKGASKRCDV